MDGTMGDLSLPGHCRSFEAQLSSHWFYLLLGEVKKMEMTFLQPLATDV